MVLLGGYHCLFIKQKLITLASEGRFLGFMIMANFIIVYLFCCFLDILTMSR